MKLEKLINHLNYISLLNKTDRINIKGIACNSRLVKQDYLFVAVKGANFDGHNFIGHAIKKGAKAVVFSSKKYRPASRKKTIFIQVSDGRQALSRLCACFYQDSLKRIKTIGITGTNGKTTTSYLIDKIISVSGSKTGVIGTINYKILDRLITSVNTTPSPEYLYPLLNKMVKSKVEWAILEVSSHALKQKRVECINFDISVFTNLGSDHMDYHKTKNDYFKSKAKLFKSLKDTSFAVINNEDHYALKLKQLTKAKIVSYGLKKGADLRASNISLNENGIRLSCAWRGESFNISSPLFGMHNVYNILAAVAAALCIGVSKEKIKKGIKELKTLPGRMEPVKCGQPFKVFIDYAHTEDALKIVLTTLRGFSHRKLYLVFGCGGERDRGKRAKMGKVAGDLADFTILTNDNPRGESPRGIIDDICSGIKDENYKIILDRAKAIRDVLLKAREDDIVLIAGKGHEGVQILKNGPVPFNDQEVVQCLLFGKF